MFDWLFGGRKGVQDFGFLHTDMHAHWLPGIDDGANNLEESLDMIVRFKQLGYKKLIATPHVMSDLYPNTSEKILESLNLVCSEVKRRAIGIELEAAAEYLVEEHLRSLIEAGDILTLPGNQVLIEYSFVAPPPQCDEIIFMLQARGYTPILAHPERYLYYHHNQQQLTKLVDKGVKLQINLGSLTGMYGSRVHNAAVNLIHGGLVSYAGTDAHNLKHLDSLHLLIKDRKVKKNLTIVEWDNPNL